MNSTLTDYIDLTIEDKPIKRMYRGVSKEVKRILELSKRARNDDKELIRIYVKNKTGYDLPKEVLNEVSSFESITRCRRKIQEGGEYEATDEVHKGRAENEQGVREWAVE